MLTTLARPTPSRPSQPATHPTAPSDTWLTVADAAAWLHVPAKSLYAHLDRFLVCWRPLPGRVLISSQSIRRYSQATMQPDFWRDRRQQSELETAVAHELRTRLAAGMQAFRTPKRL